MPLTFLWKQKVLSTPRRLVKFSERASGVLMGAVRTVPTSDQVPELM